MFVRASPPVNTTLNAEWGTAAEDPSLRLFSQKKWYPDPLFSLFIVFIASSNVLLYLVLLRLAPLGSARELPREWGCFLQIISCPLWTSNLIFWCTHDQQMFPKLSSLYVSQLSDGWSRSWVSPGLMQPERKLPQRITFKNNLKCIFFCCPDLFDVNERGLVENNQKKRFKTLQSHPICPYPGICMPFEGFSK